MKLQYALDLFSIDEVIAIIKEVEEEVDIIEIGTPMILHYGMEAVKKVRAAFPSMYLFADMKICDGGEYESDLAFNAGANMVSVMGFTHEETIEGVIRSAKKHQQQSFIDMMCVDDLYHRSVSLVEKGADYICVHNATDALDMDKTLACIKQLDETIDKKHLVVAGGINPTSIDAIAAYNPAIMVVGTYITNHANKVIAIQNLKKAYKND